MAAAAAGAGAAESHCRRVATPLGVQSALAWRRKMTAGRGGGWAAARLAMRWRTISTWRGATARAMMIQRVRYCLACSGCLQTVRVGFSRLAAVVLGPIVAILGPAVYTVNWYTITSIYSLVVYSFPFPRAGSEDGSGSSGEEDGDGPLTQLEKRRREGAAGDHPLQEAFRKAAARLLKKHGMEAGGG
jgi:hypothetical protein